MPRLTTFDGFASTVIVHSNYLPEANGFMRLGDIKGEFSPSHESVAGSSHSPCFGGRHLNEI